MKNKRYWPQVEILYALGILLVLIGHSHSSDWSTFEGTILDYVIGFIYTFHMPLFFFIAGFLLQNSEGPAQQGYGRWVRGKAMRLLVPYLVWTFAGLLPKYYLEHRSFAGMTPQFLLRAIFVPRENIWGHFWFLPVIFLCYVLFGAVCRVMCRQRKPAAAAASAVLSIGLYMIPWESELLGFADLKRFALYFALGMLLRAFCPDNLNSRGKTGQTLARAAIAAGLTAVAVCLWRSGAKSPLLSPAITILMLAACWLAATLIPSNKATAWLSGHNFTVYLFSWFFQAAMMLVCDRLHFLWITTFFCMFTVGLAGPILLSFVLDKIPLRKNRFFCLVFGMR